MEKKLKISVITPSFNQGVFIKENIESVLNQAHTNFEHIIIDGGSCDETVPILQSYPHLIWVSEKDRGQTHALNKGLNLANGDIICWINSDDFLAKNALDIVNSFFIENPDKYVVCGNLTSVNKESAVLFKESGKEVSYNGMLNGDQGVQQPSTFFRKVVLEKAGYPDETFHYCMDREFFIRVAKYYKFYSIDSDLASFRRYSTSKTGTSELKFVKDILRIKEKHNARIFSKSNLRLLFMFVKEPFKRITVLRTTIRKLKGKHPDFIHYPNVQSKV